uniref:hypothetical protein n=1 Tax=Candidatus Cryptobacteroides bacterium TaxID=3085639 RepID=UPI0040274F25
MDNIFITKTVTAPKRYIPETTPSQDIPLSAAFRVPPSALTTACGRVRVGMTFETAVPLKSQWMSGRAKQNRLPAIKENRLKVKKVVFRISNIKNA